MFEVFLPVAAATERLRSSLLGSHLDEYCSWLVELGYQTRTVRNKLYVLAEFAHWMAKQHLDLADLDEESVDEYLKFRRHRTRRQNGARLTVLQLLGRLRSAGVIPVPAPTRDCSALGALLGRYETYLCEERALGQETRTDYLKTARQFAIDCLGARAARFNRLRHSHVREFLLACIRRVGPKRAQSIRSGLRSFLRFLFLRSEIQTDLALAVPTIRRWQLSSVPRYVAVSDVERVLRACDLSSAIGRRDRAILLLLARLGLRGCEIRELELDDLRWREGEIVVRGKGSIRDRLPLLSDVGEALALYLERDRPRCNSRRVFIRWRAPYRGYARPCTVSAIVARALARAGLAPPVRGAHLFRHSLATAMVRRGASLDEIGQVLRHRSPSTTEIYAKLDFDALRDVAMPWPTARGVR